MKYIAFFNTEIYYIGIRLQHFCLEKVKLRWVSPHNNFHFPRLRLPARHAAPARGWPGRCPPEPCRRWSDLCRPSAGWWETRVEAAPRSARRPCWPAPTAGAWREGREKNKTKLRQPRPKKSTENVAQGQTGSSGRVSTRKWQSDKERRGSRGVKGRGANRNSTRVAACWLWWGDSQEAAGAC